MSKIPVLDENDLQGIIRESIKGKGISEIDMLLNIDGVAISKKPRRDGRYQGYVTKDGVKYYLYGKSLDELSYKIRKALSSGIQKKTHKKTTPTVKEWLKQWLSLYKKPNVKPMTYKSLEYSVIPTINRYGNISLNRLSTNDLQAFMTELGPTRKRELVFGTLKQALDKACKIGIITKNPCNAVEIKKAEKTHKNALTEDEQFRLLHSLKGSPMYPLFCLLLTTGLRIGEALALEPSDFDYSAKTVTVSKDVVWIDGKKILQSTPKSKAGFRTVPVPENVLKMISPDSLNFTYNAVRLFFLRLQRSTGINVSAHTLRHTYATRLEEAGVPPKVKQYLLGHASLDMTQNTYTDTQTAYVEKTYDRILSAFPSDFD